MKLKKASVIGGIILLCLSIVIVIILYNFVGPGAKDIKASNEFIDKLYSINALSSEKKLDTRKYKRIKILNSQNELVNRSVITQNFGIDLDKNNNVIGFAKKEILTNKIEIKLWDARIFADKYINNIYDGEVVLKTVNTNEEVNLPYYSFIYTKQKSGYSFYFDEIKLNINKENGFLDGYSNSTMQRECKNPVINISDQEAKKIALKDFEKYNKEGFAKNQTDVVYSCNNMDKQISSIYEVCYIVTIDGKNDKGIDVSWKIFVSCEDGNVLNILKDDAEKEVMTN
jgi:hypothetical protein